MNQTISDLIARGFGGGDAVVVPGSAAADNLPSSAPPAGVEFATAQLVGAAEDTDADFNCWVVLIGGPGNGKSFQVERIIQKLQLEPMLDEDGLARRRSWTGTENAKILVVNDATIRDGDQQDQEAGKLSREFRQLFDSSGLGPTHALISVNRGILVEEKAQVAKKSNWDREHRLISWLMRLDSATEALGDQEVHSAYYRSILIDDESSKLPIKIHAVYLDQLSLLEIQPLLDESNCDDPPQYVTMRPKMDTRDDTPAAGLLRKICAPKYFEEAACDGCSIKESCPLFANVQGLRVQQVRLGFLDVVRYAEVVSGHLFTYRDLWALLAVAIAGSPDADVGDMHKCDWTMGLVAKLDEEGQDSDVAAYELMRQRYYDALYPEVRASHGDDDDDRAVEASPALHRMHRVDPVLDATRDWAEPVLDSVQSIAYGESPLERATAVSECLSSATYSVDTKVEARLLSKVSDGHERTDDLERRAILRWRGQTLLRHYALSNGVAAYSDVAEEFLKLRMRVGERFGEFPPDSPICSALKYMLLPPAKFQGNDLCLLPLFAPRVLPITGPQDAPVWCYGVSLVHIFSWSIRTIGDAMQVSLDKIGGGRIARFELDFNICREALACRVYNGERNHCEYGFTEKGDAVSQAGKNPRFISIER